tara:strand:+ start:222 stop:404 length:183 start_codon:yes stop_codon:yes gene_type:complete
MIFLNIYLSAQAQNNKNGKLKFLLTESRKNGKVNGFKKTIKSRMEFLNKYHRESQDKNLI